MAGDWKPAVELPADILLPSVREKIEAEIGGSDFWTVEELLRIALLRWLIEWGLLEGRYETEGRFFKKMNAVRVTPLYGKVLRFHLK